MAPEHVKGYIYVEAFKQTHVKAAIDGISNLRMGSWSQQMVPIKEMTDVLRVVKEAAGLKVKQWVRIKRGVFKDDLAQVDYVDVASNQVALPFSYVYGWIDRVYRSWSERTSSFSDFGLTLDFPKVLLKLLARIDYGRNRGALRSNTMDDLKRKKFKRWVCWTNQTA